jgi:hypothetical protein
MRTPEAKFKARIKRKLDKIRDDNRMPDGRSLLYYTFAGGSPFGGATGVDLTGCVAGRYFAVEIKRPDGEGRLTTRQKVTLAEVEAAGGYAMVVDSEASFGDFVSWVQRNV